MALRADDVDLLRDAALVERFQAGDSGAFDDLYRRYFTRLRRFCQRRVGDPFEAEELAQEAFTRALRAMPGFAGERRFYPWMTVIASRLCVDAHRRRDRTLPQAEIDPGVVIDLEVDDLFASVDREHLSVAMERLAPRHRKVLELRERDGWSYQRIADHYDVTIGTVEALLHRARRALRREFERLSGNRVGGRLAGIPAVAWLLRRLDGARVRLAGLTDVATPLSATVASVAIAAGSLAVAGSATSTAPSTTVRTARPAAAVASPLETATAAVAAPAAPTAVASPRASRPSAGGAGGASAPLRTDYAEARRYNQDAPIRSEVLGTGIGADPQAIVNDLVRSLLP